MSSQPSNPTQVCAVTKGSGTVEGQNVTDIAVSCSTPAYTIGGSLTGLTGSGLVLANNGGDDLTVPANATTFNFTTKIASGSNFNVTVKAQPTSGGPCAVSGAAGTVGGFDVTSVVVNCTPNTYTVGGTITGLNGSVTIANSGGAPLVLTTNGKFAFPAPVTQGTNYSVAVTANPTYAPQSRRAPSRTALG